MSLLVMISLAELVIGTVAGVWFVILYSVRTPWWHEEHRAHLFTFSANTSAFYLLYLGRTLADPSTGPGSQASAFNTVRMVLFTIMTAAIVWRLVLLVRGPRERPAVDFGPEGSNES